MYGLKTESSFDGGHRWRVVAYLRQGDLGAEGTERDMVLDFGEFKRILREETDKLDHTFLVEEGSLKDKTVACLKEEGFTLSVLPFRTTAENLARYFAERLQERGLPVSQVDVYETPLNCASYFVE